jgi:hypothetical protein
MSPNSPISERERPSKAPPEAIPYRSGHADAQIERKKQERWVRRSGNAFLHVFFGSWFWWLILIAATFTLLSRF